MQSPFISIVSPVYRAEKIVAPLVAELIKELDKISTDYEIILVEDGSPDKSWEAILEETRKDKRVKGMRLSRNFGQHYAITAGLDCVSGEWIVVMDCDLQDKPSEIIKLYNQAREGHKIVLARREVRNDTFKKKISSKLFYKTLSFLTGVKQDPAIANFGIYHKDVINVVSRMREPFRNFAAIVKWVGFSPITITIEHSKRASGKSTYNFNKLMRLAIDTILAYSNKPLYYIVSFGFLVSFIAFGISIITLIKYVSGSITVLGYTSLILSIWFLGGLLITFLGVVGLYIGKMFEGIKNRPIYIIAETKNFNN
ncbi:MAG TPA: glycosyltransferase family 2 protein [Chitinophagaceae bacterium]|nr:glycosyltransferase family 2 protein [Chitinophagaceae bacterium]